MHVGHHYHLIPTSYVHWKLVEESHMRVVRSWPYHRHSVCIGSVYEMVVGPCMHVTMPL